MYYILKVNSIAISLIKVSAFKEIESSMINVRFSYLKSIMFLIALIALDYFVQPDCCGIQWSVMESKVRFQQGQTLITFQSLEMLDKFHLSSNYISKLPLMEWLSTVTVN